MLLPRVSTTSWEVKTELVSRRKLSSTSHIYLFKQLYSIGNIQCPSDVIIFRLDKRPRRFHPNVKYRLAHRGQAASFEMEPFLTSLEKSKRGYQMSDFDLNNEQYDKSTVEGNLHLILTARGFMDTVREGSCSIDHLKAFTDMIVLGPESERVRKLLRRWIPELRLRR